MLATMKFGILMVIWAPASTLNPTVMPSLPERLLYSLRHFSRFWDRTHRRDGMTKMTVLHSTGMVGWVRYLGTGIRKPIAKAAQELPDSPRSNRRPPILPFFQHLHAVHVVHLISERTEEVRVLPYSSACPTRSNGRRPGLELGDIEPGW
jgi:hypothetical protein